MNEELITLAKELFWWQPPEVSLPNPRRFLAQVMTLGTWDEVKRVKQIFGIAALKDVLVSAQAGVFDVRSWAYWHAVFGLPEAPLPQRSLETLRQAAGEVTEVAQFQPLPGGVSPEGSEK